MFVLIPLFFTYPTFLRAHQSFQNSSSPMCRRNWGFCAPCRTACVRSKVVGALMSSRVKNAPNFLFQIYCLCGMVTLSLCTNFCPLPRMTDRLSHLLSLLSCVPVCLRRGCAANEWHGVQRDLCRLHTPLLCMDTPRGPTDYRKVIGKAAQWLNLTTPLQHVHFIAARAACIWRLLWFLCVIWNLPNKHMENVAVFRLLSRSE